ncbi:MAG: hypothetical protein EXR76_06440 [Myxococcales bacterium]|nr:hypothetical protein [Myxococcales bacterium]
MKTVTNKTRAPLQVPLPGNKILRLGPGMSGQIRVEAAGHGPILKLIEAGQLEMDGGKASSTNGSGQSILPGAGGRGHGPTSFRQSKGDR